MKKNIFILLSLTIFGINQNLSAMEDPFYTQHYQQATGIQTLEQKFNQDLAVNNQALGLAESQREDFKQNPGHGTKRFIACAYSEKEKPASSKAKKRNPLSILTLQSEFASMEEFQEFIEKSDSESETSEDESGDSSMDIELSEIFKNAIFVNPSWKAAPDLIILKAKSREDDETETRTRFAVPRSFCVKNELIKNSISMFENQDEKEFDIDIPCFMLKSLLKEDGMIKKLIPDLTDDDFENASSCHIM